VGVPNGAFFKERAMDLRHEAEERLREIGAIELAIEGVQAMIDATRIDMAGDDGSVDQAFGEEALRVALEKIDTVSEN